MMRTIFPALAVLLAASGCKVAESTTPLDPTMYHITATISGSNACTVTAPDNTYSSVNNITGDLPKKFVSTFDRNYHGFSCWVSVDGGVSEALGAGFFNVIFSGNTLGKPLAVGTYKPKFEILDETPAMYASIRFKTLELNGDEYRPLDTSIGSIVVDSTADGTRNIHVDLQAFRFKYTF
jgi:hypothetical protein